MQPGARGNRYRPLPLQPRTHLVSEAAAAAAAVGFLNQCEREKERPGDRCQVSAAIWDSAPKQTLTGASDEGERRTKVKRDARAETVEHTQTSADLRLHAVYFMLLVLVPKTSPVASTSPLS